MKDSIIQYGPKGSSKDIENILTHIFNINNEISNSEIKPTPLCIWGTHGLGKTEMVRDYAKNRGWHFAYIAPAQFEEMGDLHGLPTLSNSSDSPTSISKLLNVKKVYLSNNKFTILPEQIREMKNLTSLYISGNQIKNLPKWISELKNLNDIR